VTNNTKDQGAWGPAHASAIQLPARKLEHLMVPPTEVAKLPCFLEEATIMMELLKRHATSLEGQAAHAHEEPEFSLWHLPGRL
jgi:hypothetical protein